jgi:hypothetical protein
MTLACQRKPVATMQDAQATYDEVRAATEDYEPVDADGDGFNELSDCDDNDPYVNPFAEEIPGNDIDDDCNPNTSPLEGMKPDQDGDGYTTEVDCDDDAPLVHPGAREIPGNGIDDDCDPATADDASGETRVEIDRTSCALKADHVYAVDVPATAWSLDFRLEAQRVFGDYKTIAKGQAPIDGWITDVRPDDDIAVIIYFTDPMRAHETITLEKHQMGVVGTSADTLYRATGIDTELRLGGDLRTDIESAGVYGDRKTGELAGLWIDLATAEPVPGTTLECIGVRFVVPPAFDLGPDLPTVGDIPIHSVQWKVKAQGRLENVSLFGP